jgi:hypothetical protein
VNSQSDHPHRILDGIRAGIGNATFGDSKVNELAGHGASFGVLYQLQMWE